MSVPTSLVDVSTTAASNSPAGSENLSTSDDYHRQTQAMLKGAVSQGSDISSGSTLSLPAFGANFDVTGTTGISAISSTNSWDGREITLQFDGICLLTHSASFDLGGFNIKTSAGERYSFKQRSSGSWVLNQDSLITQKANNVQFAGDGAKINRLNDRVFVGDACVNDGAFPNVVTDWLTDVQLDFPGGPATGSLIGVQFAVLANETSPVGGAFLAGAHSLNQTNAGQAIIPGCFFAVNDCGNAVASPGISAWGVYVEAHRMADLPGPGETIGMEIDTVQRGGTYDITPYAQSAGMVNCLQLVNGAGLAKTGQYDSSAALYINSNSTGGFAKFRKGIVFGDNSITGTDGLTGAGTAIAFAKGHVLQWYNSGSEETSFIVGDVTTAAQSPSILMNDGQLVVALGGDVCATFNYVADAVNQLNFFGGASGSSQVAITCTGDDANVNLVLTTKGTNSVVQFKTASNFSANTNVATTLGSVGPAGSNTTVQEWLTVLNASGVPRYIPCF